MHWRVQVSEKAIRVGVSVGGGTVVLYRRHLVGVTGLSEQAQNAVLAEWSWEWAPIDVGKKLELRPFQPTQGRVLFRKYDDGWRIDGSIEGN